jgi:branched-chain amino acid transport system permease protein
VTALALLPGALGGIALVAYPFVFTGSFAHHLLIMVFLFATLSLAWDVLGGHAYLFSFGHAAFFGIGAYTSTVLYLRAGLTPWIGLVAAGVAAGLVGLAIGFPTAQLRGHYFAIASLALTVIAESFFTNWTFVGGAQGLSLPVVQERTWAHMQFHQSKIPYYFLGLGVLAATILAVRALTRSWIGYYLRAFREAPELAASLGVNNTLYRLIAIGVSAFFTGIAGSFYAQYVLYIDPPSVLGVDISIKIVLLAVFGGSGTLWGPVLGAGLLIPLMELSRVWLGGLGKGFDHMLLGVLIVVFCLVQPDGIIQLLARPLRWLGPGARAGERTLARGAP